MNQKWPYIFFVLSKVEVEVDIYLIVPKLEASTIDGDIDFAVIQSLTSYLVTISISPGATCLDQFSNNLYQVISRTYEWERPTLAASN